MFEDAMMESSGTIKTRSRYYAGFGVLLNGSLLAALILVPLLYPDALPKLAITTMLVAPPPPPPQPPQSQIAKAIPSAARLLAPITIPGLIRITADNKAAPQPDNIAGMDASEGLGSATGAAVPQSILGSAFTSAPRAIVKAPMQRKINVSQGVMAGNILSRPAPAYPSIARAAHIQGLVVLAATISKSGDIENLTVMSGPPMLTRAALDAVRQWRYKPYLLNGQPIEVQTQINVTFTMAGG